MHCSMSEATSIALIRMPGCLQSLLQEMNSECLQCSTGSRQGSNNNEHVRDEPGQHDQLVIFCQAALRTKMNTQKNLDHEMSIKFEHVHVENIAPL